MRQRLNADQAVTIVRVTIAVSLGERSELVDRIWIWDIQREKEVEPWLWHASFQVEVVSWIDTGKRKLTDVAPSP